ncbi:MAG: SGNH/GDSL hydrolase family protein [Opitutaceae bacterium]|jgi:lysophospholipase L1-like esterase
MLIRDRSTLLFIGDSITDCGRDATGNPTPWNLNTGLGRGYVEHVASHFGAVHPESNIRVINRGISGDTVRDLAARWSTDVIAAKPDWLSIMIGINDVWRQFDQPLVPEAHVPLELYERTLARLVRNTRPKVSGLILMTPYFIEPNRADPMRRCMDEYGAIVKKIARRHKACCVDTQAAFDTVLVHTHPMTLAWDRIHPNSTGHTILARAFLSAIGA